MIDPVTLAVLKGRLEQIADEMDTALFRSAFNPIIAEAHDASHGIYDAATGDTLVQGKSGLPIFVGAMSFAVKAVIGRRPKFDLALLAPSGEGTVENSRLGSRQVWVEGAWHETAVYERLPLPIDAVIEGPALLEQPDTTIFVEPDLAGTVDKFGNLIIARKE